MNGFYFRNAFFLACGLVGPIAVVTIGLWWLATSVGL